MRWCATAIREFGDHVIDFSERVNYYRPVCFLKDRRVAMIDLAISAIFAFGPISFDQLAIRDAIARTIGDWKGRNIWVESRHQSQTQDEPLTPSSTTISAVSPSGRYFLEKTGVKAKITCYCADGAFTVEDIHKGYKLTNVRGRADSDDHFLPFVYQSLSSAFMIGQTAFYDLEKTNSYQIASRPLGSNRFAVWGRSDEGHLPGAIDSFCGIVQFSDDRTHALFVQSDTIVKQPANRTATKTAVRFIANRPIVLSAIVQTSADVSSLSWVELGTRTPQNSYRTTYDVQTDFNIPEAQLLPEYYGISRQTVFNLPEPESSSSDRTKQDQPIYFLALIIPLAVLAALYWKNRTVK